MDAIKLLKDQHDEVEDLFKQYEKSEDSAIKRELFVKIADNLSAHATIEEKLFYPAVYVGEMQELLHEAVEEHLGAKRIIADLLEMSVQDENFDAKMKVLKEQIEHHIEEEEGELFPKVRKSFAKEELEALGTEMEAMFEELEKGEPRKEVPAQTDEAAPLG
jgi:hemerythrin-like domain-containing protein